MAEKRKIEPVTKADLKLLRDDMSERFTNIETKMATRDEFLTHMDKIYKTIEDLKQEYYMVLEGRRRIEGKVDKIDALEARVEKVEAAIT